MGMKGFKGFEKDFSCRGKQYEENTTYEEHGVGCCHKGVMHFCEDPWEVLNHYDLVDGNGNFSEFAEVEALGQVWNDGEKRATNKIHIGAKLGFKDFLKHALILRSSAQNLTARPVTPRRSTAPEKML